MKEEEGSSAFQAEAEQSVQKHSSRRHTVTLTDVEVVQNGRHLAGSRAGARDITVAMLAGTSP